MPMSLQTTIMDYYSKNEVRYHLSLTHDATTFATENPSQCPILDMLEIEGIRRLVYGYLDLDSIVQFGATCRWLHNDSVRVSDVIEYIEIRREEEEERSWWRYYYSAQYEIDELARPWDSW